ncbi:hypothetical protein M5W82_02765 [Lysinibacillus xylanilyticus]|uniref:Uncharacterized protein n=1 Tax=Lysinibacillus xylanilyticus TaxID=582475 RepID=A0ABT4EJN0_9BACI|nr:hypothetical protein [Lysinibacillus xylanilyticus]
MFAVLFTVSAFYVLRKYKKTKWKENVIKKTLQIAVMAAVLSGMSVSPLFASVEEPGEIEKSIQI